MHAVRDDPVLALLAMALLGVAGLRAHQRRTRGSGALLLLAALLELFTNRPFEGPSLLVVVRNHGVTVGDVPALLAGAAAWVLLLRRRCPDAGRPVGQGVPR